jgi:hypothetical protein
MITRLIAASLSSLKARAFRAGYRPAVASGQEPRWIRVRAEFGEAFARAQCLAQRDIHDGSFHRIASRLA